MIKSFRHKGLAAYWETGKAGRLPVQNAKRVARMLRAVDDATRPEDLNLPGYRFHELKGARAGTYALLVTGNWRLTFGWADGDAYDVQLEDYH